jgi:hypothetical protein
MNVKGPFPIEPERYLVAWLVVTVALVLLATVNGKMAVVTAFGAFLYAAIITVGVKK